MRKYSFNTRKPQNNIVEGDCTLCGGKGRYKETFKYKNPIIKHCWECRGTGKVKQRVVYIGETDFKKGLYKSDRYLVLSRSDNYYVIHTNRGGMMQIPKTEFENLI